MEFAIFFLLIIIYLYVLYKLVKDDYVFIRKNISIEQIFDLAFLALIGGTFFSRLFYFLFSPLKTGNVFFATFSPGIGGFSLIGGVLGGLLTLLVVIRLKKAPLGRLLDFFTLALLCILPIGFLAYSFLQKQPELYLFLLYAVLYFVLALFYFKSLYPKILSKTQKEGNSTLLFLIFF